MMKPMHLLAMNAAFAAVLIFAAAEAADAQRRGGREDGYAQPVARGAVVAETSAVAIAEP